MSMFKGFSNAFKIPELRKKILITLGLVAVCRLVSQIPTPGVDWRTLQETVNTIRQTAGGGILDFNGKTGEVARVTYGVGGGSIINAENVVLPQGQSFTIDVEDLRAGRSVPVTGDFNFDGVEIRLTGDLNRLDPEVCRRHTLVTLTGGRASGMPMLTGSEVPEGWVLVVEDGRVRLMRPCGFTLTVR